jgi:hypothetical protein
MPSDRISKIEQPSLMDYVELKAIIENLKQRQKSEDCYFAEGAFNSKEEERVAVQRHNELIQETITLLLNQKERFGKIYRTSGGSIYFVLQDGKALRIRTNEDIGSSAHEAFFKGKPGVMSLRKIVRKNFLIDKAEHDRLYEIRNSVKGARGLFQFSLVGQTIRLTPYEVGAHPIEFDAVDYPEETVIKENSDTILLEGLLRQDTYDKSKVNLDHSQIGIVHFGHKITEILK